jgi:alanine racemase
MLHPEGKLTIDLSAVRENYQILRARVKPGCTVAAAVKANAYGLGAHEIVGALIQEGCNDFFVAGPEEALRLRAQHNDCNIYVLSGFYQSRAEMYPAHNLIPVLGSFMEIKAYSALARAQGKALPALLQFNTRMNRMGLGAVETQELVNDMSMLEGIDLRGIMSHLACADEPEHPMNETQHEVFSAIAQHFLNVPKSLANSSGIFLGDHYHFDMVRPGMALYGLNPTPERENPMRAVVSLEVPIMRVRLVYQGATVGYGATYAFERDSCIATISAGYADGIFRALSNKGAFYWKGIRLPIRGRVSMDLTTVDVSDVPEGERPRPGDYLEILGSHQSADDLARDAGTIGYEVLTNLGNRYARRYIG